MQAAIVQLYRLPVTKRRKVVREIKRSKLSGSVLCKAVSPTESKHGVCSAFLLPVPPSTLRQSEHCWQSYTLLVYPHLLETSIEAQPPIFFKLTLSSQSRHTIWIGCSKSIIVTSIAAVKEKAAHIKDLDIIVVVFSGCSILSSTFPLFLCLVIFWLLMNKQVVDFFLV